MWKLFTVGQAQRRAPLADRMTPHASSASEPLRVVLVTNIPAPYRVPVFNAVVKHQDIHFHVIYCSEREPDRSWDLPKFEFSHEYLKERLLTWKGRYIHYNTGTWRALKKQRPQVVMATGFNPTHLIAYAYARLHGLPFVPMTDGTKKFEDLLLTPLHRWVRRHVFARSSAFVGAAEGSFDLYRDYGIDERRMFKSHLCANNAAFNAGASTQRDLDFLFSARFVATKRPEFAVEVAARVAQRLGRRVSLAMLGDGPLTEATRAQAQSPSVAQWVDVQLPGFIAQAQLPRWFGRAKVFLLPTEWDAWGVVANEASASGTPTLITPHAGAAHELVVDGVNGRVLPLELDAWVDAATELLSQPQRWSAMSEAAPALAEEFTHANAAEGLAEAVRLAAGRRVRGSNPLVLPRVLRPTGTQPVPVS